jgi:hypothetical protein
MHHPRFPASATWCLRWYRVRPLLESECSTQEERRASRDPTHDRRQAKGQADCARLWHCRTDGELLGRRDGAWLAGSIAAIAYTQYGEDQNPGIVFAGTP